MELNEQSEHGEYLGSTIDNAQREVDAFSDGDYIVLVWNLGEENEEISTSALKTAILKNPDKYIFTPYIEFINLFK